MKILIACEESGIVTEEFRKRGHNAWSCDLLPTSGDHPEWHIQDDVLKHLNDDWDIVISFPPCTDLAVSGARWFKEKRENGSQEKSIRFFFDVWKYSNCCENPIGILNGGDYIKRWFPSLYIEMQIYGFPFKPDQIIQPWQFGHGETKATCLWLYNLPLLKPTDIVEGREQKIWKMAPGPERSKLRSRTFPGLAKALAFQYGNFALSEMTVDEWNKLDISEINRIIEQKQIKLCGNCKYYTQNPILKDRGGCEFDKVSYIIPEDRHCDRWKEKIFNEK